MGTAESVKGAAEQMLRDAEQRFGPGMDEARERLERLNQGALELIKAHPGKCLLGAIGLGFLVGRLASRR